MPFSSLIMPWACSFLAASSLRPGCTARVSSTKGVSCGIPSLMKSRVLGSACLSLSMWPSASWAISRLRRAFWVSMRALS
ncbi:hypothetical protein D3C75_1157900 [compost metagenome]